MIIFEKEALDELREIGRWYARHRPRAAERYFEEFRKMLRRIQDAPEAFPRMHGARFARRARLARFPYRIVYLVANTGAVHVLAIPHDSRRPMYWKGRLRRFT